MILVIKWVGKHIRVAVRFQGQMAEDFPDVSEFYSSAVDPSEFERAQAQINKSNSEPESEGGLNNAATSLDPQLDITSAEVSWERCIAQKQTVLPCPNAVLNVNIVDIESEAELFAESLTKEVEKQKAAEFSTTKLDKERKKKQEELRQSKRDERRVKYENYNLLISNVKRRGPQAVLSKALKSHRKVCVVTRSFKGIRGFCVGFLLAYDRYCNICLIDVCEVWRTPLYGDAFYKEEPLSVSLLKNLFLKKEQSSTGRRELPLRLQKRNVRQLFINGSNVVLVTFLSP